MSHVLVLAAVSSVVLINVLAVAAGRDTQIAEVEATAAAKVAEHEPAQGQS